jgi:hypothetical protein
MPKLGDAGRTTHGKRDEPHPYSSTDDAYGQHVGVREQSPTSTGLVGPLHCVAVEARPPPPRHTERIGWKTRRTAPSEGNVGRYLQRTFFASVTSNICDSVQWNGIHISYARLTTRRTVIMFHTPRVRDVSMTAADDAGCRHARTALPVAVAIR